MTGEWCIKGQMSNASEDSWGMHQRTDEWCIRGQVSDASNNRLWHALRVSAVTGLFVLQYYLWLELMMNHYGCHRCVSSWSSVRFLQSLTTAGWVTWQAMWMSCIMIRAVERQRLNFRCHPDIAHDDCVCWGLQVLIWSNFENWWRVQVGWPWRMRYSRGTSCQYTRPGGDPWCGISFLATG